MVITRLQASVVRSAAASKLTNKVNDQPKSRVRGRSFTKTSKRLSSPSPTDFIHRPCSQLSKMSLYNDDTKSFTYRKTACVRASSSDSTSTYSSKSFRSSVCDTSSSASTSSSRSSSPNYSPSSNTTEMSPSSPHLFKSATIPRIIEDMDKMQINNTNNSFSPIDTSSSPSQQSNFLPESGLISVYKSTRNGHFLCFNGYTYQIDRRMKTKIKWKCKEIRNKIYCRAKIYTTKNLGTDQIPAYQYLDSNNFQHSHEANHDQQQVSVYVSQLKDIGKDHRTIPPSKIVNELATSMKLTDAQLGMVPRYGTLYQKVYRVRSKTLPPLPKSITFEIPTAFSITSSGEKFLFFDHLYAKETKRILAFASPMQLNHLFNSKIICFDGTFSICPRQYKQLLIIQTIDRDKYDATPVVYALFNDKKTHTYRLLFQALKQKAKEMKMKFEPDRIISDFESGMIATVKKQLPNTIHQGCLFHLYQNLTKQMKKVGLWTHYKNNDALHLFIKKIMAIVLLKPILMDNAYQFLFNQYLKEKRLKRFIVQLTKFMFYFQKQWMKPKIRKMLSFYDVDFKTNNWSESYNAVLQRRAQQSHLSIWTLLALLITEETGVRMKHFQLLNGKTKIIKRRVRNDVIEMNQKVIEFNEKLENDEIQLDQCLLLLASLVGVKYDKWRKQRKKNKTRKKEDNIDN